jgi:hypothetical protein
MIGDSNGVLLVRCVGADEALVGLELENRQNVGRVRIVFE